MGCGGCGGKWGGHDGGEGAVEETHRYDVSDGTRIEGGKPVMSLSCMFNIYFEVNLSGRFADELMLPADTGKHMKGLFTRYI